MATALTAQEIIALFELTVDDTTELSTAEELALLNRIYQIVCEDRPWEILKKEASGTLINTGYVTVPADFSYLVENRNYTNNAYSAELNAKPAGVLINGNKWLQIINWSDRRQYNNVDGYVYYDPALGRLVFTYAQPAGATYSFDYKAVPDDLTLATSPIFPAQFHQMFAFKMATDDMATQLFDKARSYAQENERTYMQYMHRLASWNASLQNY